MDTIQLKYQLEKMLAGLGADYQLDLDEKKESATLTLYLDSENLFGSGYREMDLEKLDGKVKKELQGIAESAIKLKIRHAESINAKLTDTLSVKFILRVDMVSSLLNQFIKEIDKGISESLIRIKRETLKLLKVINAKEGRLTMSCCRGNKKAQIHHPTIPMKADKESEGIFVMDKYDPETKILYATVQGVKYEYHDIDPDTVEKLHKISQFSELRALAFLKKLLTEYRKVAKKHVAQKLYKDTVNPERFSQIAQRVNALTTSIRRK